MASKKAPGVKIIKKISLKTRSTLFLVLGIVLIVAGIYFTTNAPMSESTAQPNLKNQLINLYGLSFIVFGLVFYAKSCAYRAKVEAKKVMKKLKVGKSSLKVTKLKSPAVSNNEAEYEVD